MRLATSGLHGSIVLIDPTVTSLQLSDGLHPTAPRVIIKAKIGDVIAMLPFFD